MQNKLKLEKHSYKSLNIKSEYINQYFNLVDDYNKQYKLNLTNTSRFTTTKLNEDFDALSKSKLAKVTDSKLETFKKLFATIKVDKLGSDEIYV